jgi:hypothetical protein
MTTNKNGANPASVVAALQDLRRALNVGPASAAADAALAQCDRLETAISQFHAAGLRFAAFTLIRIVQNNRTAFVGPVQNATLVLEAALGAAGYPH